jgi:hypothetical protein
MADTGKGGFSSSARFSRVMGGLVADDGVAFSYATVHGTMSKRRGRFQGKLVTRTEHGQERMINNYYDTSWKAVNDELCNRRHQSEALASFIHEMSLRLEEAKNQKEMQDLQRMDSSFVILYKRERRIGDRPDIDVYVQSVGFNTMLGAQQGYEGSMISLGPAEDGDEIIVKRGVVKIETQIVLDCDLTFSREKNYAGGGGGGWSGGGGGGYGLGGGGGGGTFVMEGASNVEIKVGSELRRGREVVVGNVGDGCVSIREPITGQEWSFESVEGAEEWLPPSTGMYIIKAMGGAGASAWTFSGGTGASVEGMFHLVENEPVILVVGKMGKTYADRWGQCGGGGGATCLFLNKMDVRNAMIVAGGGGGAAAPYGSNGSDGAHANTSTEGRHGIGEFHGLGGRDGHAGSTRHIRTCFINSTGASARFMSEDKVRRVMREAGGFFPGAGSGISEFALGASPGASMGDPPDGPGGVAEGGFGGGGCGDWHPEETRIEGHCVDAIFHCRKGSPVICDQVLKLSGHVLGAEFQPQCILVDGGNLLAERIDMVCQEGNACVVKSYKRDRHDTSPPGILRLSDCTVNDCGGNGLLVLEGGRLEATRCRLTACRKDGVDVKGTGSTAHVSYTDIVRTGARHVITSKGADVTVVDCKMDKSESSSCDVRGQGSSLKLQRCTVHASMKNGILVTEGGQCELRKCHIVSCHDVGVLVIGVEDKVLEEETMARVIHCVIKKNGYGIWAQDGAALKMLGGLVTGSVNEDVTQHTQPDMKTANKLISMGNEVRMFFMTWKKEAQFSKALHHRLQGLTNNELDEEIQRIFAQIDVDGSGEIKESELGEALVELGVRLPESEIRDRLKEMDENNDGVLSIAEFSLFVYALVERKRNYVRVHPSSLPGTVVKQRTLQNVLDRDEGNRFRFPDDGGAIVIRSFRTKLQSLCNVHSFTNAQEEEEEEEKEKETQQQQGRGPYADTPLAFCTRRSFASNSEVVRKRALLLSSLRQLLQDLDADAGLKVSKHFHKPHALAQALEDAEDDDVVLLGAGQHVATHGQHIDCSLGICTVEDSKVVCDQGELFEIFCGDVIFCGLQFARSVESPSGCTINVRGGSVLLQGCAMQSSSGSSILCTVEEIDSTVMCSECQFMNDSKGFLAIVAKDGAVAKMVRCELLSCGLYATSGGLMNLENTQIVETENDSIVVDTDGVVKARNCKVIGSFENGITVVDRGMLSLHRCAVIRTQKVGLVCCGEKATAHLTGSSIQEGWSHGVSAISVSLCLYRRCAYRPLHSLTRRAPGPCELYLTCAQCLGVQVNILDGASADLNQSVVLINKGIGCVASGTGVQLRLVDTVNTIIRFGSLDCTMLKSTSLHNRTML